MAWRYFPAVTASNIEALRAVYRQWEQGNLRAGEEILDPQIESVWPEGFPSGGTYRGRDGHAKAMREWLSPWESFELVAEAFYETGDRIVVPFRVRARGKGSGISVERRWGHVWTMRAGRAVRFEVTLDPDGEIVSANPPP